LRTLRALLYAHAMPPGQQRDSSGSSQRRLALGGNRKDLLPRRVIGIHLQLTGYGHWLPNDPRGSNSEEIRKDELADLGPIRPGRQRIQPSRKELKAFYHGANELLEFEPFWFDPAKRQALADAFQQVITDSRYTVWACAICSNHVHLCVRAHRDNAETMWTVLTDAGRKALRTFDDVPPEHPVWTRSPWKVFLHLPEDVWDRVDYVRKNPMKEGLPEQHWPFVTPYDNWPLHRKTIAR
jgi:REP element-mobilizing transposase RayT